MTTADAYALYVRRQTQAEETFRRVLREALGELIPDTDTAWLLGEVRHDQRGVEAVLGMHRVREIGTELATTPSGAWARDRVLRVLQHEYIVARKHHAPDGCLWGKDYALECALRERLTVG